MGFRFVLNRDAVLKALSGLRIRVGDFGSVLVFKNTGDVFKALVMTILTQNTSDRNAIRAYENLLRELGDINPISLIEAGLERIMEAIKPAGMQRMRAERIIELSRAVLSKYSGDLGWVKDLPTDEARKRLMELPGVGEKTADVILVNLGRPTFPVDTHITRITLRLGLVDSRSYRKIRMAWMSILEPKDYLEVHLKLIQLGREVCRPRNPRCDVCGFRDHCAFAKSRYGAQTAS